VAYGAAGDRWWCLPARRIHCGGAVKVKGAAWCGQDIRQRSVAPKSAGMSAILGSTRYSCHRTRLSSIASRQALSRARTGSSIFCASSGSRSARKELHRPLDIGKQHRDWLPLALRRGCRGQGLIGDVRRAVTLGRGKTGIEGIGIPGMSTFRAEHGRGRKSVPTASTRWGQWSSTLLAILCLYAVLTLARRAFHGRASEQDHAAWWACVR
jgi:hypothetical protein